MLKHPRKVFPMFPCKENLIKWDDYGEVIKAEDYSMVSESLPVNMFDNKLYDEDGNLIVEGEENANNEAKNDIPTKTITETVNLNVRAKLLFIDFEGRSDGESIKKILAKIKPKNMIIVHGSKEATHDLRSFCMQSIENIQNDRIFIPMVGEVVDATLDTQLYGVKLKDELVSSLVFQKIKDYELAWIDGILKPRNQLNEINEHSSTQQATDLGLVLQPFQKENFKQHKAIFINEPKLSDLKQ